MAEETHVEKHGKTIFIRNLPYSINNETLEKVFSDIGPIKSCFVVSDKDSGKCRGIGYVKYTLLEDAEKALKTIKKVEGRNVHIMYAKKKEKKKKFGRPVKESSEDQASTNEGTSSQKDVSESNAPETKAPVAKGKVQDKKSAASFKKLKQIKAEPPVKGLKQAPNPLNEGKRARLIVRNLSFKCEKEDLKKAFANFGTVVDVHIPKKASGLKMGFGFVQFANKAQAGMAVKELNGKEISGRVVAVDWSLPKDKFEANRTVNKTENSKDSTEDNSESMDVDDDSMEEDIKVEPKVINTKKKENMTTNKTKVITKKANAVKEENREEDESSSDESQSSDDDQESSEEEESIGGDDEGTSEDDDEGTSEDDDEEEDSGIEDEDTSEKPSKALDRPSDVNEGRTVFIRNMPFNTEEEELYEFFSQFGDVKYCKVVVDRTSGMSKGSAFVQFLSKESADSCVKAGTESEPGLTIGGRQIIVTMAVSRQQAGELVQSKEKKKEKKDTRNLYLAREGVIREGTEAAKDVPPADLALRAKICAANRQKLKDQNIFVSSTRLCIHNIPPTVPDQRLRKIVYQAAGDKSAKVTECRIMRDLNRPNSQGIGKSRGFAFCSFSQHEHALSALKHLNNNPNIFGDKKRPIVEFSLENRKALEIKQKRLEKSMAQCRQKELERKNKAPVLKNQASGQKNQDTLTVGAESKKQRKRQRKQKAWKDARPLDTMRQQDKVARSLHKGPLGLPSHLGPKQRHKQRPGQQGKDMRKKGNNNFQNRKVPHVAQKSAKVKPPKMMRPNKKRKDFDNFDKMVASYKQKIMAGMKS